MTEHPVLDMNNEELAVDDTVIHNSTEYQVLELTSLLGSIGSVCLGDGLDVYSYDIEKVT